MTFYAILANRGDDMRALLVLLPLIVACSASATGLPQETPVPTPRFTDAPTPGVSPTPPTPTITPTPTVIIEVRRPADCPPAEEIAWVIAAIQEARDSHLPGVQWFSDHPNETPHWALESLEFQLDTIAMYDRMLATLAALQQVCP